MAGSCGTSNALVSLKTLTCEAASTQSRGETEAAGLTKDDVHVTTGLVAADLAGYHATGDATHLE